MEKEYAYKVLGLPSSASLNEVKKAYHKLAKKYHPDFNMGKSESEKKVLENEMKKINYAYEAIIKNSFSEDNTYREEVSVSLKLKYLDLLADIQNNLYFDIKEFKTMKYEKIIKSYVVPIIIKYYRIIKNDVRSNYEIIENYNKALEEISDMYKKIIMSNYRYDGFDISALLNEIKGDYHFNDIVEEVEKLKSKYISRLQNKFIIVLNKYENQINNKVNLNNRFKNLILEEVNSILNGVMVEDALNEFENKVSGFVNDYNMNSELYNRLVSALEGRTDSKVNELLGVLNSKREENSRVFNACYKLTINSINEYFKIKNSEKNINKKDLMYNYIRKIDVKMSLSTITYQDKIKLIKVLNSITSMAEMGEITYERAVEILARFNSYEVIELVNILKESELISEENRKKIKK